MRQFSITYEILTPESVEDGEAAETGFAEEDISLRDAYEYLRWNTSLHGEPNEWPVQSPSWVTFYGEMDYTTGETTNYSLHFPRHITAASKRRICRLFR